MFDFLGANDVPFFVYDREADELLYLAKEGLWRIGPFVLCAKAGHDIKRLLKNGQIIVVRCQREYDELVAENSGAVGNVWIPGLARISIYNAGVDTVISGTESRGPDVVLIRPPDIIGNGVLKIAIEVRNDLLIRLFAVSPEANILDSDCEIEFLLAG